MRITLAATTTSSVLGHSPTDTVLTVCGHDEKDHDSKGPFEVNHEEHQRDCDIGESRQDIEHKSLGKSMSHVRVNM